jgi:hypothetical protein
MSRKPPQVGVIKAIDQKRQAGWLRPNLAQLNRVGVRQHYSK